MSTQRKRATKPNQERRAKTRHSAFSNGKKCPETSGLHPTLALPAQSPHRPQPRTPTHYEPQTGVRILVSTAGRNRRNAASVSKHSRRWMDNLGDMVGNFDFRNTPAQTREAVAP